MCHSSLADVYLVPLVKVILALAVSMVPQWPYKILCRHSMTVKLSQILFESICNVLRNGTLTNQALFWTLSTKLRCRIRLMLKKQNKTKTRWTLSVVVVIVTEIKCTQLKISARNKVTKTHVVLFCLHFL